MATEGADIHREPEWPDTPATRRSIIAYRIPHRTGVDARSDGERRHGCAGGISRDILLNKVPAALQNPWYVIVSIGAAVLAL